MQINRLFFLAAGNVSTLLIGIAGDFTNLTFDNPDLTTLYRITGNEPALYTGPSEKLLSGWKVEYDGAPVEVLSFSRTVSSDGITLIENPEKYHDSFGPYSLDVWAWKVNSNSQQIPFQISIYQNGVLPSNVIGLRYFPGDIRLGIYVNDILISADSGYADVSKFSGQAIRLEVRFSKLYTGGFDIYGFTTVPEPSEFAMLGLGLGVIGWQAWKRQRAHQSSLLNGGGRGSTHAPSTSADPM